MTNILPDHPGDLLDAALDDALILSRNKDYILDSRVYHEPTDEGCVVCLVGAVMARRLSADINKLKFPCEYDEEINTKLEILNEFVFFRIKAGLEIADIPLTPEIKLFCKTFKDLVREKGIYNSSFLINEKIYRKLANELRILIPKEEEKCQKEQITKQKQEPPRLKLVG